MRTEVKRAAMAACVVLAGCGDGSGGSSGGGVDVVAGAPAAPSPTASPSPAASPSPSASTPSPSYASALDHSADWGSFAYAAEQRVSGPLASSSIQVETRAATLLTGDNMALLQYTAATKGLSVNYDRVVTSYLPADDMRQSDQYLTYARINASPTERINSVNVVRPSPTYSYVLLGRQTVETEDASRRAARAERYLALGVKTLPGDVPTTGVSSYALIGSAAAPSGDTTGVFAVQGSTLRIDHATRAVTATVTLRQLVQSGQTAEVATLTLTGTVSAADGGFTGTIASNDSGFAGEFSGRLFGPAGVESGAAFVIRRADGARVAGHFAGRRG